MASLQRPDLSDAAAEVVAYIEALEAALDEAREQLQADSSESVSERAASFEPSEPPTTINVVTITASGAGKRTPRHLYGRQRRGGMGVFGLDGAEHDPPAFLTLADESASLLLITDQGRVFRVGVRDVPETPVAGRARPLLDSFPMRAGEQLALVVADPPLGSKAAYLVLVTERGQVRRIGNQYLGKSLQSGAVIHNVAEGGAPAAACWSSGGDELFIVTRGGQAIRFAERLVPVRGCLGIRVDPSDAIAGAAAVPADGGVFLLGDDGKGTIRLMSGFAANKSPGAAGKIAMRADRIVGAAAVTEHHDVILVSKLGKVIRFLAGEVPPKEGVVQGVNCMSLRADECRVLVASPPVGEVGR